MLEGKEIQEIAKKIERAGGRLYLVGGAVRDKIMGKARIDEDYCVTGLSQIEFEQLFPEAMIRGKEFAVYDMEKREFALARKERKSGKGHKEFEIETDKSLTIEEDLARRDITINSIAKDVLTGKIIDPYGGIEDIKRKVIRKTSDSFLEDPLRVYRVARFAAMLVFEVEETTIEEMKKLKEELQALSVERVFTEFKKALGSPRPSIFFQVLKKADVLEVHFKEIYDLIGKTQPEKYHPEGDSFNHTMNVVDNSSKLTDKLEIRYSCLVHDLGKGKTPEAILPHHYGHEERGEKLVVELGARLKVPKLWTSCGKIAAKHHMKGGYFEKMTPKKQIDFIEKVAKSKLGLEGMKVVVYSDKWREEENPPIVSFDIVGNKCIQEVDGKYVMQKYCLKSGLKLKEKLHEERVEWIKNNYKKSE